jgi:hypothetical protein
MKTTAEPTETVQHEQLLKRQNLRFAIFKPGKAIMKPNRTLKKCARYQVEANPLQPIGNRQMLEPGRPDHHGRRDSQSIKVECVGVVRRNWLGGAGDDGAVDRGAPDNVPSIFESKADLNQSGVPTAASRAPTQRQGVSRVESVLEDAPR